ncbi:MAG: DNA replication/repair protein RecF [Clostridium sp.]|nr:DNA replication/repair protein RecF [Clostridium sp.]
MYIEQLELENFRNYKKIKTSFSKNINIIYGENAQGKTNIIEAIFLCAAGRSHRTSKDKELININSNKFKVKLLLNKDNKKKEIEYLYELGKKQILINEVPIRKMANLMGNLLAVIFSPEDILIVKEGPSLRRRFMDITISQLRPSYFYNLQQYNKILNQRNNLLKEIQQNKSLIETLDIWDEKIAQVGSEIISKRKKFIDKLSKISKEKHYNLTDNCEQLEIKYKTFLEEIDLKNKENIKNEIIKKISKSRNLELKRCITAIGPHRDDFDIIVNGLPLKNFGSQGQQRTAILSLKLSEIEIIKEETDEYPILLLDDVMSELDNKRRKFLFKNLTKMQTFITCTEKDFFKEESLDASFLKVKNGEIYNL